jgi:cation transport regulator ChaC
VSGDKELESNMLANSLRHDKLHVWGYGVLLWNACNNWINNYVNRLFVCSTAED